MEQAPKHLSKIEDAETLETTSQKEESKPELGVDNFSPVEKRATDQQELRAVRERLGLYTRSPEKEKELMEDIAAKTKKIEAELEELSQTISRNGLERVSFDFKRTNAEDPLNEKKMQISLENLAVKISRIGLPEGNARLRLETRNIQQVMEALENVRKTVSGLDDVFEKEFSNLSEYSKKVLSRIRRAHSFLSDAVSLLRRLKGR